jgi:hypothetical protein
MFGSMFRANRRGTGEFCRPRRRQRENARDDAGKHECQSGRDENKRQRPMPSPHRHGAEKCTNGDRQGESQEYGGKYRGECPNGTKAVLDARITGGDLHRRKNEECRKCEYADSEFHIDLLSRMVFQECRAIRDGHLDSSIKSPPVYLLHDLLHRNFVGDSWPLHIMGKGRMTAPHLSLQRHFATEPNLIGVRKVEFPGVAMAGIHGGGDRTGREAVTDRIDRHDAGRVQGLGSAPEGFV